MPPTGYPSETKTKAGIPWRFSNSTPGLNDLAGSWVENHNNSSYERTQESAHHFREVTWTRSTRSTLGIWCNISGAGAGLLGALSGDLSLILSRGGLPLLALLFDLDFGPGPDSGAIDHGICHLDLAHHCGLLAKGISGFDLVDLDGLLTKEEFSRPSGGLLAKGFYLVDLDGLLTKKEFLADLLGVYWLEVLTWS
ncbi:hypothetical protein Taro_031966, partial [Colocasia esculenta]|nr:hypothetical protein [Colocasia esculenta]